MHDEQRGLFDAIAEQPDADHDRHVYADWLEDHGDAARAEFVRLQLALARLPEDHPDRAALLTRERGLLLDHEDDWTLGLRHLAERWEFRRGFVDEVRIHNPPRQLTAERFDEVFAFPFVRRLTTGQGWRLFPGLLESEGARRLETLHFAQTHFQGRQFRSLVDSPRLERLTALKVPGCGLSANGARRLASSDLLGRLRVLDLSDNPLGDEGIVHLARSPHVGNLTHLELSRCRAGRDAALALASAPLLAGLRSLKLAGSALHDQIPGLLRCTHFDGLTELDLSDCGGDENVWRDLCKDRKSVVEGKG